MMCTQFLDHNEAHNIIELRELWTKNDHFSGKRFTTIENTLKIKFPFKSLLNSEWFKL